MSRTPIDFARRPVRGRFERFVLDAGAGHIHGVHGRRKSAVLGSLSGTIVELGPGTGANMAYYPAGVRVIGIEPNPVMHGRLRARAAEHGVDLEIRELRGERLDVADAEADAVVATLVLCGVDDPGKVLAEVRRVLRPGGSYFFLEHVAAPAGSKTRAVQRLVKRPHRWLFNGCEVDRDTAAALRAAGFDDLDLDHVDTGPGGAYTRHHIVGVARRAL